MLLELNGLSKKYAKNTYGLKDFSLRMENGVLGLLGPNGAGKSTLLKMIATISCPTDGTIVLNKNNVLSDPNYMRKQLGFLPQYFGVYPNLNAYEFLSYIAAMKGIGGKDLKARITHLLTQVNLLSEAHKPIGNYSGGMKQRIGIAQALLNNPKVLIFDEPTVGLDPVERIHFRNLISELSQHCIIILSSHIVSDIDTIADQVAIMKKGSLLARDSQENLIKQVESKVFQTTIQTEELEAFKREHIIVDLKRNHTDVTIRFISDTQRPYFKAQKATLEDAYLYFTNTNTNQ